MTIRIILAGAFISVMAPAAGAQGRELVDNGLTLGEAAARIGIGKTALHAGMAVE